MKKIMYVCDKCGKVIDGNVFKIMPEAIERGTDDILPDQPDWADAQRNMDYCVDCTRKALQFLACDEVDTGSTETHEEGDGKKEEEPEEEDSEDSHIQPKNAKIKVKKLPGVKNYATGKRKSIDKHAVYADYLNGKGTPKLVESLAKKYGCSVQRVWQIIKEVKDEGEPNE
jgi:hypothetical protein